MKNISKGNTVKSRAYGVFGMLALVLFGGMIGYVLNGSDHIKKANMSQKDCNIISEKLIDSIKFNAAPEKIAELNKIYSENCVDRIFDQPKPQPKPEVKKLPEQTCEAVEELLKQSLNDENSTNPWDHDRNSRTYNRLAEQGCIKNKDKYLNLAQRESEIAKALDVNRELEGTPAMEVPDTTCEKIEVALLDKLYCRYNNNCDENEHVNDAQVYANLSERGCPENSSKYKEKAKQELEIARALTDDDLENEPEVTKMVETYKRLQMQAEAIRMIEKAKKLTNPAIDFIIQLEKIIEE